MPTHNLYLHGSIPFSAPFGTAQSSILPDEYVDAVHAALKRHREITSMVDEVAKLLKGPTNEMLMGSMSTPAQVENLPRQRKSVIDTFFDHHEDAMKSDHAVDAMKEMRNRSPQAANLMSIYDVPNSGTSSQQTSQRSNVNNSRKGSRSVAEGPEKLTIDVALKVEGVEATGHVVNDLVILPVTDRKVVKQSILSLRAIVAIDHPDLSVIPVLHVDEPDASSFVMQREVASLVLHQVHHTAEELSGVLHAIAVSLNLVFSRSQQFPLKFYQQYSARELMVSTGVESQMTDASSENTATSGGENAGKKKKGLGKMPSFVVAAANHLMPALFPFSSETTLKDLEQSRFRPEFLRLYSTPLCSTAFYANCPLGSSNEMKLRSMKAFIYLCNVVVPTVARGLDSYALKDEALYGDDLCDFMHLYGVNLRFLGWLLPWLQQEDARRGVLTEIVARSYKHVENVDEGGDGEDEEGTDFATLTRIAMNKFFPPHLQVPLPTFHPAGIEVLRRLNPRFGIDVDTLEVEEHQDGTGSSVGAFGGAGGVDLKVDYSAQSSLPPTPNPSRAYEYDSMLLPSMVDGEKLEARIIELCHVENKLRALPGRIEVVSRQCCLKLPSRPLTHFLEYLQDALLARSDVVGKLSPRLLPLLHNIAEVCATLYPFESECMSDQSALLYTAHARDILEAPMETFNQGDNALLNLPQMTLDDIQELQCIGLLFEGLLLLQLGEVEAAQGCCNDALQVVRNPRVELRLMMLLASTMDELGEDETHQQLVVQQATHAQNILPPDHPVRKAIINAANRVLKARGQSNTSKNQSSKRKSTNVTITSVNTAPVAGTDHSFAGHGVSPYVVKILTRQAEALVKDKAVDHFVSPNTTYINLGASAEGAQRTAATMNENSTDDVMNVLDGFLTGGLQGDLHPLKAKKCLVLFGHSSKTTVFAETVKRTMKNISLNSGSSSAMGFNLDGSNSSSPRSPLFDKKRVLGSEASLKQPKCDYLPVYVDCSKHAPMDSRMLERALKPLDAFALEELSRNPRVVLFLDSVGEGPMGLEAVSKTSGALRWSGKIVISVDPRLTKHCGPQLAFSLLFPVDADQFIAEEAKKQRRASVAPDEGLVKNASSSTLKPTPSKALLRAASILRKSIVSIKSDDDSQLESSGEQALLRRQSHRSLKRQKSISPANGILSSSSMMMSDSTVMPYGSGNLSSFLPDQQDGDSSFAGISATYTKVTVEMFTIESFDERMLKMAFVKFANSLDGTMGNVQWWMHTLKHRLPRLYKLLQEPLLLTLTLQALLPALTNSESAMGWVTTVDVLDLIVCESYLRKSSSVEERGRAATYAIGLALRMYHESSFEITNEAAAEFVHCLPIKINHSTKLVSFVHPVFRSYFIHMKFFLETLNPRLSSHFTNVTVRDVLLPLITPQKEDAHRKTEAAIKGTIMRGFAAKTPQSTVLKAVGKMKGVKTGICGGEWMATKSIATCSDLVAVDLLCDRVLTSPTFHRTLVSYLTDRRDFPMFTANSATLLVGAGCSLSGMNLKNANLSQSNLTGMSCCAADARSSTWHLATLCGANLDHTELHHADFKAVDLGARLKMSQSGSAAILASKFAPDTSDTVATGDEKGIITLWEVDTAEAFRTMDHGSPVSSLDFSPDAKMLVAGSASSESAIKVFSCATGHVLAVLIGHSDRISDVSFCGSDTIVSSSFDWTVKVWSLKSSMHDIEQLEAASSKKRTLGGSRAGFLTSPLNQKRKTPQKFADVSRSEASSPKRSRPGGTSSAPLSTTPTPKKLVPLPARSLSPPPPGLKLGSDPSARPLGVPRNTLQLTPCSTLAQHTTFVTASTFNPMTRRVASLSADGVVKVCNVDTGSCIVTFRAKETKGAAMIRFSPDGARLALPDVRGIALHSPDTGALIKILAFPKEETDVTAAIAFSPDGVLIAAANYSSIVVWNAASQDLVFSRDDAHKMRISALDFNPVGTSLVSTSWDTCLRLWPMTNTVVKPARDDVKHTYRFLRLVNRNRHVMCVTHRGQVDIRDVLTGTFQGTCVDAKIDVSAAAGDSTSDYVAVGSQVVVVATLFRRKPAMFLRSHLKAIAGLTFIPRPESLVNSAPTTLVSVGTDRSFRLWNAETGGLLSYRTGDAPLLSAAPGANGFLLVAGFLSTKALTLEFYRHEYFPEPPSLQPKKSQSALLSANNSVSFNSGVQKQMTQQFISGEASKSFSGPSANHPQRGEMCSGPLKALMHAAKQAFGVSPNLIGSYVTPFMRTVVSTNKTNCGPVRIHAKEGTVRSAVGVKDSVAVVTVDKTIYVWSLAEKQQIRCGDVHFLPINAVDICGDVLDTAKIATASGDGTVIIQKAQTGDRIVSIRPGVNRSMIGCRFIGTSELVTSGNDLKVRKWNIDGAKCCVGNKHNWATMSWPQLETWLLNEGLGALRPALNGMCADDLIAVPDEELPSIIQSFKPSRGASPTRGGGGENSKQQPQLLDPTGVLTTKLQQKLHHIRQQSYRHIDVAALDDATITREMFASYSTEKVQEAVDRFGLVPLSLLCYISKTTGQELISYDVKQIQRIGATKYEDLVQLLYDEMNFVRTKIRDSFADKTVEEVALWAKPKHPLLRFAIIVAELSGMQLLDKTSFQYKTMLYCNECKNMIPDSSIICPETGLDHGSLAPVNTTETQNYVNAIASRMEERHVAMCQQLFERLARFPSGVFSGGLFWYKMIKDSGALAVASFHVPGLSHTTNLVVNSAKLTVYSTESEPPRMVAFVESNQGNSLHSLSGLTQLVDKMSANGGELPLPLRWERTVLRDQQVIYQSGTHAQDKHPSMPKAGGMGMSGTTLVGCTEVDPSVDVEGTQPLQPPKEHHFFKQKGTQRYAYEANVLDHVLAAVQRRHKLRLLIVAESMPVSQFCYAHAKRPTLEVNYYHSDQLCNCATVSANVTFTPAVLGGHAVPNSGLGTPSVSASSPPSQRTTKLNSPGLPSPGGLSSPSNSHGHHQQHYTAQHGGHGLTNSTAHLLCDRYCNIESTCTGHTCSFRTDQCRTAPYLVWQSVDTPQGSFNGIKPNTLRHLSSVNKEHIEIAAQSAKEALALEELGRQQSTSLLGGDVGSGDDDMGSSRNSITELSPGKRHKRSNGLGGGGPTIKKIELSELIFKKQQGKQQSNDA